MVILKYPLKMQEEQVIHVPAGRQFIACQIQGSCICLWVIVNPLIATTEVKIRIVGTGCDFSGNVEHLGTVQDGGWVWHVFRDI